MTVMLAVIYITTGTISVMAGEPENNDAQKKESVSDSVKVQTSENTDEDRPKENSWRYSNGELIPQEDDATSNARAVTNAWKKVNGQFVNSLGKPIPGAKKKGMDISEYQGTINWDTVKNRSDIDFVIIRCSYGSGYKDRKWEYNVKECERLGIPYGVYIYSTATTVSAVEKEAENVKKMLEGHQPTYPVYFDMEENSVLNLGSSTIGKLANTFCSKISGAGYKVGIYASLYWWNSILTDRVFKNESWSKWVAQYSASCQYQSKYDMWQCTSSGKVNGVSTNVDINFWMSDEPVINQDADRVMVSDENIITYTSHMQSYGWQEPVNNGYQTGKPGYGKRLEAFKINVGGGYGDLGVRYQACIQDEGWKPLAETGQLAGTEGKSKYIQAVKISLTGSQAENYDIYYRVYSQNFGWLGWTSNGQPAGSQGYEKRIEALQIAVLPKGATIPGTTDNSYKTTGKKVEYRTYVEKQGWKKYSADGEQSGTIGQARAVQGLAVRVNDTQYSGNIVYDTYMQSYGWMGEKANNTAAGILNGGKRMEAIKLHLTGELAEKYDIYYRVHTQTFGWLDWAKNGKKAGSSTYGKRLEAIEIKLVKKGESAPGSTKKAYQVPRIQYQTHVQSIGWQKKVSDNQIAGTTGQGKRIEAIKITLPDSDYTGNVEYQAYVQGIGWQSWKKNGELAGTSGQSKRIEAIRVKLTGEIAKYYEVYYSIHLAKIGWCNYESAGRVTGTIDLSKKIEALKICLVKKDAETAPNTSGVKYVEGYKSGNFYYNGYIKGVGATGNVSQGNTVGTIGKKQQLQSLTLYLDQSNKLAPSGTIQYATHIAKEGWKDWSDAGTTNGASTGTNGMEAVKIRLTGNLAKYYDIYYRAHVQGYGWLGWAKNGQAAGTSKIGYRMEGLQIRLVSKDAAAPGKNANYYTEKKKTATIAVKDQMHLRALAYASNTRYLILVDTTANRVGIYSGSVGKWNEVKKWVCTTGAKSTPTVKGTFTVQGKGKSFGSGYTCWYYTQFYGNYLFHSVLYKQGSMSVIIDGRLGINASHGCVRLNINNAKWIYDNIPRGTKVVVY